MTESGQNCTSRRRTKTVHPLTSGIIAWIGRIQRELASSSFGWKNSVIGKSFSKCHNAHWKRLKKWIENAE
jgi:hypothetical protein